MRRNVKRILNFCLAAVIAISTVGYAPPSFALNEMTTKSSMEEAMRALASPSEAEKNVAEVATQSEAEIPGDKATPSEAVKFVQIEPEEIPEYYSQVKKAGKKFWKFEDRYGEMQYRDYGYVEGEAEFPLWYEVDDKSEIELSISVDLVDEYYNLAPYVYDNISPTKSNWSDLSSRLLSDNESIFLYERQEVKGFTNWDFSTYSIWYVNGILKKDLEGRDLNEELGYFFYGSISNVRDSVEQWYYADNEGCIYDMSPTIDPGVSLFAANQVEIIYNLCNSDDPTNGTDNIKYTDWVDVSDGNEYYTLKDYTLEGQRLLGYMRGASYYDLDISSTTRGNKTIRFSPQNYNYPYHVNYNVFYPSGTKIKKKDLTTQVFYAVWVPDNYDVLVALYEEDLNFPYSGINGDKYLRFVNDRFMDRPYGYPIKGPFGYWNMKRIMVKKKGVSYNLDLIPRNGITLEGTTYWKNSPLEHGRNFNATFDGWVTEDGEKLSTWVPDGSGKVTYIFPKWNLQNHLVTFKGIDGVIETQQVPFGSSATEPKNITTPNGFKFIGWDTDFSDIREDIVVNAKYEEKKTVSVTYKDWEGNVIGTQVVGVGESATLPAAPARTGYTFVGWDTDTTSIGDHTVVKPIYKINSYVLTLDANGGALNGKNDEKKNFVYGDSFDQSLSDGRDNATRKYHTFDGWYTKPTRGEKYAYTGNKMPADDVTAYAHWSRNASLVTYKDWGGRVLGNQEVVIGGNATPPADPERQGYTFIGWDKPSTNIMDDTTIVAKYNKNNYKLILEGNGGGLDGSNAEEEYTITYGGSFDQILLEGKNNVSRPGYTFDGWYSAETEGNCYSYSGNVMPSNDLNVYAQWKVNEYTVHYDGNLEALKKNPEDKLITYGQVIGELPVINAEGYIFLGWYTDPTRGTKVIEETPILGDTTYYAQWDTISKPTVPDPIKPEPENRVEEEKITVPITPIIDSTAKPTVPDTGGTFAANPDNPYDVTYTKPDGTTARDEWVGDGKDWYHIDEAGKLNYDWYLEGEKTWYKLKKEPGDRFGAALTGWNYEPMYDKSYFFDPSTTKMLTGWQLIDSKWYYFTKQNESQTYYGSNPSGSNSDGWKYDPLKPGKPYGSMYQDEFTPDGYRVDENGVWKNK